MDATKEARMNVVRIRVTRAYFRRVCVACGHETDKEGVVAVLDQGDGREAAICAACIEAGPELIGSRIIQHAEELERHADELRRMATEPFEMPTLEALEDARLLEYEMEE